MNTLITTTQTTRTGRQILNIQAYKSADELSRAHPEVKSWTYIYYIPRGMGNEAMRQALTRTMQKQGHWYTMVYHVGDFIMAAAVTTTTLCICLEHIGDNGNCPVHGKGL